MMINVTKLNYDFTKSNMYFLSTVTSKERV